MRQPEPYKYIAERQTRKGWHETEKTISKELRLDGRLGPMVRDVSRRAQKESTAHPKAKRCFPEGKEAWYCSYRTL
jgi:hypothetical protein